MIKKEDWELIGKSRWAHDFYRLKVPGGWIIQMCTEGYPTFFYPDPEHKWDGYALPR